MQASCQDVLCCRLRLRLRYAWACCCACGSWRAHARIVLALQAVNVFASLRQLFDAVVNRLTYLGFGTGNSYRELAVPISFGNDSDMLRGMPGNSDLGIHVGSASRNWRSVGTTFMYKGAKTRDPGGSIPTFLLVF